MADENMGGQDQPTPEQAQAQEDSTALLDKATGVLGTDQSQAKEDTEQAVGYSGHNPSPVPNHHYTVSGVTANLPTPETDPDLREEMHRRLDIDRHMAREAAKKESK